MTEEQLKQYKEELDACADELFLRALDTLALEDFRLPGETEDDKKNQRLWARRRTIFIDIVKSERLGDPLVDSGSFPYFNKAAQQDALAALQKLGFIEPRWVPTLKLHSILPRFPKPEEFSRG